MHCAVNSCICGQGPDNGGKKIKRSSVPPLTCECGKPLPVFPGGMQATRTLGHRAPAEQSLPRRCMCSSYFLRLRVPPGRRPHPGALGRRRHGPYGTAPAPPPRPAPPNRQRYRPVSSALPMVADGGASGPAGRSPGGSPDVWHGSERWGCAGSRAAGAARPRFPSPPGAATPPGAARAALVKKLNAAAAAASSSPPAPFHRCSARWRSPPTPLARIKPGSVETSCKTLRAAHR